MKSKDLIKQLQKIDPNGEAEVVVDGDPIYFAEHLEGYWDGWYEVLIQDHSRTDYNIKGTKFTREGSKVRLHIMDYEAVLLSDPDAKMEIHKSMDAHSRKFLKKQIAEKRAEMKKIHTDVDEWDKERKDKEPKEPETRLIHESENEPCFINHHICIKDKRWFYKLLRFFGIRRGTGHE